MRINTNINSLYAIGALDRTSKALSRSLERLASGRRINEARDDASGLARAVGLESQIRGLAQTARNINDAMGFLQTADSAMASQADILQRMRELAMQAANGTVSSEDRSFLNSELQSLFTEYERIADQTEFNGAKLLDGSFTTTTLQVGTSKGETIQFNLSSTSSKNTLTQQVGVGIFGYAGTSSTSFNNISISTSANDVHENSFVDVNGDGKQDIVALTDNAVLSVILGNGNGTFASAVTYQAPVGSFTFKVIDVNGDGKRDIVTTVDEAAGEVFYGNGDGTFVQGGAIPGTIYEEITQVSFNDANQYSSGAFFRVYFAGVSTDVWLNIDGAGNYDSSGFPSGSPDQVIEVEIDSTDTYEGVASKVADAIVQAGYIGNWNGSDGITIIDPTGSDQPDAETDGVSPFGIWIDQNGETVPGDFVALGYLQTNTADINNDGVTDTIANPTTPNTGVTISLSSVLSENPANFLSITTSGVPNGMSAVDLNDDDILDLAWISGSNLNVSFGLGDGTFDSIMTYASGTGKGLTTGDFNNDGLIDIATTSISDVTMNVFLGTGEGRFASRITKTTGTTASEIRTADFNGDGILDLVNISEGDAFANVYIGNGDGTFRNRVTYTAGSIGTPTNVRLGDVDRDGNIDIMSEHGLLRGNGDGTFRSLLLPFNVGPITSMDMGDIDHDGNLDVVVRNSLGGQAFALFGAGNGTFSSQNLNSSGSSDVQLADVDNDGNLDVLIADVSGSLKVLQGRGDRTFSAAKSFRGSNFVPSSAAYGDLNGDGATDVVITNSGGRIDLHYGTARTAPVASSSIDISTAEKAQDLLGVLDNALQNISHGRAQIGAVQSRLQNAQATTQLTTENLSGAKSQLLDVDYAEETAELVRNQVLQQAQTAVLGQANQNLSMILRLLDF